MLCILSILAPSFLSAKESVDRDSTKFQNWKFAAGITLYSNMTFNNPQYKQPLEFNFRYTPDNRHTFRLNIPLIPNHDLPGDSRRMHFNENFTVEEFADLILQGKYSSYDFVQKKNQSLYGMSLGYDYSYPLISKLSLFAGVDAGYYRLTEDLNFYNLSYIMANDEIGKIFRLSIVTHEKSKILCQSITVKPLIGLRYQVSPTTF